MMNYLKFNNLSVTIEETLKGSFEEVEITPSSSCDYTNNKIDTRQIHRKKENFLIDVHRILIEMGLKKWPEQAAFILFAHQKINNFGRNWQDKDT